jgi:hypothetical protein
MHSRTFCLAAACWLAGTGSARAADEAADPDDVTVLHDLRDFFVRTLLHPETARQVKRRDDSR